MYKSCCFIGHRTIEITDELIASLTVFIENLIVNENVRYFLFGSKSEFDDICHSIVSNLKEKYSFILRVECPCRSESPILEKDKEWFCNIYEKVTKQKANFNFCDEIYEFPQKYSAGRASYIERNNFMIDKCDICIFYCNKNLNYKSGTKIAYNYAQTKNKQIFNFCN